MLRHTFLLLTLSIAWSTASAERPLREEAVGSWRGTVTQPGNPPYSVEMHIREDPGGKLSATARYPELGCSGILTLVSESSLDIRFLEKIDPPNPRCVSTGYVYLVRAGTGTLVWGWAPSNGPLEARASLTRGAFVAAKPATNDQRPQGGADLPPRAPEAPTGNSAGVASGDVVGVNGRGQTVRIQQETRTVDNMGFTPEQVACFKKAGQENSQANAQACMAKVLADRLRPALEAKKRYDEVEDAYEEAQRNKREKERERLRAMGIYVETPEHDKR